MPEKLKKEQVEKMFFNKGYTMLEEYKNSNTPILCSKDGYRYRISYANLKNNKNPSLWGFNNIVNLEHNIKEVLRRKQSDSIFITYKIIQKKNKKRILLHFICSCGKEFDKILEDAVYGKFICCNDCQIKKRGKSKRLGPKVIEYVESKGYKIFDKTQIYRNNDLVEVENEQGFRGFVSYSRLKANKGMSLFDIRINKKHYIYNVNNWAKNHNIDIECIGFSDKKYYRQALEFKCSCGNKFVTSISNFQSGKICCEKCSNTVSKYERIFKQFLEELDIKFIYQYSLNQCRDILPLPFDFYIIKDNILVEIDGEGHFHPCNFNRISNERALLSFQSTQKHDKIKNTYCEKNNIPLLRIPYYSFKDESYKQIFLNFRQSVANSG